MRPLPVRKEDSRGVAESQVTEMASALARLLKERSRNYGAKIEDREAEALLVIIMLIHEVGGCGYFFNFLGGPPTTD